VLDRLTAGAFRLASSLRGDRAFHPDGVAFLGRWEPEGGPTGDGSRLLGPAGAEALVRFSRGAGLPHGFPDVLGVAVKILDAHGDGSDQDLALASSLRGPFLRRLLVPQRDFSGTVFSSIAPYEVAGRRVVVLGDVGGSAGDMPFDRLADAPSAPVDVRLRLSPGDVLGRVRVGARLPDELSRDLRFDPWNTGPDLEPVGWLNRLRQPTYAASQEGRDAPDAGVRAHLPTDASR
jgi:hypothetical protein